MAVQGLAQEKAQLKPAPGPSAAILAQWNEIGRKLIAMAEDFPEDKYDFKASPTSASFSQRLIHGAAANYFFTNLATGQKPPGEEDPPRKQFANKAAIVAYVKKSFADGAAAIQVKGDKGMAETVVDPFAEDNPQQAGKSQIQLGYLATSLVEHSGEVYGQLSVYYRVAGMIPPESWPKKSAEEIKPTLPGGKIRTYYVAADEVSWDYVPGGVDVIADTPYHSVGLFPGQSPQAKPVEKPVPTAYLKTIYREYTDDTFRVLTPRPPEWEHLGFLGPLIRAEVGDTIQVLFRNNAHQPHSIHPHGVFYNKDSEGAPYNDGTSGADKADDSVSPGATHLYTWQVPERAGPAPGDVNSVMWMYHSHTNEYRDPNSGLLGPMIITARGQARADGSPKEVDREFVVWFAQVHEEDSWHVDHNLPTIQTEPSMPQPLTGVSTTAVYPHFVKFSINGFSHGSLPLRALTMRKGEHIRWYLFSGINDFDFHTPHWHGNTVVINQMRTDVTFMAPMQMVTADMVPDDPGIWLFHCHISFHNAAGMAVRYSVTP